MNIKALNKVRKRHRAFRAASVRASDLIGVAEDLGRVRTTGRGKEPTFLSREFPDLRPLTIPMHGGKDLKLGTKNSILNQLEDDISRWEMKLEEDESEDDEETDEHEHSGKSLE